MKYSVALCTYNGKKYIEKQLLSIINQTIVPSEIIVCDDSKDDITSDMIKKIAKKHSTLDIKIFKNNPSLGVVKNFMKAFSLCKYEIIFGSDQDDIWELNKAQKILEIFQKNKSINVVATDAVLIDGEDNFLNSTLKNTFDLNFDNELVKIDPLLIDFCVTGATMAYRKKFLEKNICFPKYCLHDAIFAFLSSLNNSLFFL